MPDTIDSQILSALQTDAHLTPQEPGEPRDLSPGQARHPLARTPGGGLDELPRVCRADLPAFSHLAAEVFLPRDAVDKMRPQIVIDQCGAAAPLPV
ncbi:MAG: hypothetical protein AAGA28_16705 [Pseudomonadota bacterium]